jgi:dihydroorotase
MSIRLGLRGWPNAAEDLIVSRNVILSEPTPARTSTCSTSPRPSTRWRSSARPRRRGAHHRGGDAPPHRPHRRPSGYDPNFKMNPPLRTEADRRAIIAGLRDGTLDCIATDHAPHTDYEKDKEFDFAPNGILGLETALAVVLGGPGAREQVQAGPGVDLMTRRPAGLLGLPRGTLAGRAADICLFDPDEAWPTTPRPGRASRATRRGAAARSAAASRRRSSTAGSCSRSRRRDSSRRDQRRGRCTRGRGRAHHLGAGRLWLVWRFQP